jgi:hypothetical protein
MHAILLAGERAVRYSNTVAPHYHTNKLMGRTHINQFRDMMMCVHGFLETDEDEEEEADSSRFDISS